MLNTDLCCLIIPVYSTPWSINQQDLTCHIKDYLCMGGNGVNLFTPPPLEGQSSTHEKSVFSPFDRALTQHPFPIFRLGGEGLAEPTSWSLPEFVSLRQIVSNTVNLLVRKIIQQFVSRFDISYDQVEADGSKL